MTYEGEILCDILKFVIKTTSDSLLQTVWYNDIVY